MTETEQTADSAVRTSRKRRAEETGASGGPLTAAETDYAPGRYDGLIRSLTERVADAKPFAYDVAADPLYRQYAERYAHNARLASDDTLADAAAYTGGYGNSYAVSAANGAYNNALAGLNDIVPELYRLAYDNDRAARSDTLNALNAYTALDKRDYERYRDRLADEAAAGQLAYEREQDILAQENFLKELYAKYPKADPNYTAPAKTKTSGTAGGKSTVSATGAENCERFLKSLTSSQRRAVYNGTDATNTRYREEIIASVGQDGYDKLKKKYV